jgi:hypothetical protein
VDISLENDADPLPLPRQGLLTSGSKDHSSYLDEPKWLFSSLLEPSTNKSTGPNVNSAHANNTRNELPPRDHNPMTKSLHNRRVVFHDVGAFHSKTPDSSKS